MRLALIAVLALALVACAGPEPVEGACYRARYELGPKAQRYLKWDRVACPEDRLAGTATAKLTTPTPDPTPRPFLRPRETRTPIPSVRGAE